MINNTIERLRTMKMNSFASELERQMEDKDSYNQLGFEERLTLLVDSEWNRRQDNKLTRFIRNARFSAPSATIEGIEYIEDRHLDKAKMLRFATCQYINDGRHIILKGASGNGKTYIACALGNAACRKYKSVRYIRMPELLDGIPSILQRNIEKQNSRGTKPWEFSNLLYRLVQTNSDLLAIIRQRIRPWQQAVQLLVCRFISQLRQLCKKIGQISEYIQSVKICRLNNAVASCTGIGTFVGV